MQFLQQATIPKGNSHYLKFQEGENKFRILSEQGIEGWEDWIDNKPVRYRFVDKPNKSNDPKKPFKHFLTFIVWDYVSESVKIMEITQQTIKSALKALNADPEWGSVLKYDLKVIKTGKGKETEYVINPLPHKPLAPHIAQAFAEKTINLEALFDNGDPFNAQSGPVVYQSESKVITDDQFEALSNEIADESDYRRKVLNHFKIESLQDLPKDSYNRVFSGAQKAKADRLAKENEFDEAM